MLTAESSRFAHALQNVKLIALSFFFFHSIPSSSSSAMRFASSSPSQRLRTAPECGLPTRATLSPAQC
ncbi:unnamed protein product [Aureobasidium mustum]|uniref:Uncharacterized protein n=1 Tax=Aureobasidium mustum TaxID=2773714 RepID=A0A9N8K3U0_9PEZI|nr:unnamed protein product [Aureobasidium mustum]